MCSVLNGLTVTFEWQVMNDDDDDDDDLKTIRIKISEGLGILARLRHCLPSRILVNLYYTLVHPYFYYCNIIWATGSSTSLNNLFLLQNRLCVSSLIRPGEHTLLLSLVNLK